MPETAGVGGSDEWRDVVVFTERAAADAAHVETSRYKEFRVSDPWR
jgi:hypothetical protein